MSDVGPMHFCVRNAKIYILLLSRALARINTTKSYFEKIKSAENYFRSVGIRHSFHIIASMRTIHSPFEFA